MYSFWSEFSGFVVGIGLSAACGFRIILPLLGLSIAVMNGYVQPAPEFQWIGTWPALIALATAAVLEIGAYYIPWLDNLLDAAATPLAVAAGTIAAATVMGDMPPFLRWSLALIAGGGMAGTIQVGTSILRGMSTATTGGMGNILLSTAELAGSAVVTLLALIAPAVAFTAAMIVAVWIVWKLLHRPIPKS